MSRWPDCLVVGGTPLDRIGSTQAMMARAWAREGGGARVLYLVSDGRTYPGRRGGGPEEVGPGLFSMGLPRIPGLPRTYPGFVRRANLALARRPVLAAIDRLGLAGPVALYYGWYWGEWVHALGERAAVYDCTDEHRAYPHVAGRPSRVRYVWRVEATLLARADLLVGVSEGVLADRRGLARARAIVLANGVDAERFRVGRSAPEPAALARFPRPRAILSGNLRANIDLEAVARLARARPDLTIVLLGARAAGYEPPPFPPNVHELGAVPPAEVPAYLAHADVGLLPLVASEFNRVTSPLRLVEYLAAGLPVAALATPGSEEWARDFGDAVRLASELAPAVGAALARGVDRDGIAALVAGRTWAARCRSILARITGDVEAG